MITRKKSGSNSPMSTVITYIAPTLLLVSGLIFIVTASLLGGFIPQWATLFALFFGANIGLAKYLHLSYRLKSVWSFRKLIHFPIGVLIGVAPSVAALVFSGAGASLDWSSIKISSSSIAITFIIVTWEELWFRGIALEYASMKYSKIGAASVFSIIFCLLHIFNPNLDLISAAPDLILGGYALALSYFVFDSMWAPIGMHFGNNLLEGSLQQLNYLPLHAQPLAFLGIQAIISIVFTAVYYRRRYR